MRAHPEDQVGVLAVPAAADVFFEEAPGVVIVVGLAENADPAPVEAVANVEGRVHVFFPDDGEEEWAGAVHDGDVGELPVLVVGGEGFDDTEEEWMLRDGAHGVVGDTRGDGTVDPCRVREEWVQAAVAALGGSGQFCLTREGSGRGGLRRLGRCKCRRSGRVRNSGLRRLFGWGSRNYRNCRGTKGIPSQ